MEFFYQIFGLVVKSEIELPEAYEIEEQEADVKIKYGEMPLFIKRKQEQKYLTSILLRKYKWFYFENEANFLIEEGSKITVELDNTADEKHIRALLLGPCLGSILYQRENVTIHGAAVVWKDIAIVVSGVSGAGKSTISSELRKKGCIFMADDTVAITSEDGIIYANPSYPQQKLCPDAAIRLGYDLSELILLQEESDKYAVRLKDSFCSVRKKVGAFIYLDIHEGDELIVNEITDSRKLEIIVSNLYTYLDCKNAGLNTNFFNKCLEMAQKVPVIKVERPIGKNMASLIADQIIGIVEGKNIILV
ncbi:MAG: phosphoenolpyruvate carboxykinase (ATP) [Mobilitalea sp.]